MRQWAHARANGDHYRKEVISQGGTRDYFEMFKAFAGREPDVTPMLESRGLVADSGENAGAAGE